MRDKLFRKGWPSFSCALLLKAYASPDEKAFAAWKEWLSIANIEDAGWAEVRLLAAIASKVARNEEDTTLRKRLEGIRRHVWTNNQLHLRDSLPMVDILNEADIPVLLFKGGARLVSDPNAMKTRFVRDLDLLIKKEDMRIASKLLIDNHYRPMTGKLPGSIRSAAFDRAYAKDHTANCEVDIHRSTLRYGRSADFDDTLWERSKEAVFRGRRLNVPSPTDQFMIAVAHGFVADADHPADWAVDAMYYSKDPAFSWDMLVAETKRRKLAVPLAAGLAFLDEELGWPINDAARTSIEAESQNWLFRREFASDVKERRKRRLPDYLSSYFAEIKRSKGHRRQDKQSDPTIKGWPVSKLPFQQKADLEFSTGSGEMKLVNSKLNNRSGVFLDLHLESPPKERMGFDLLIDDRWMNRLRLHPINLLPSNGGTVWRFHIPLNTTTPLHGEYSLTLIELNAQFLPV